jgi:hypothetical protein
MAGRDSKNKVKLKKRLNDGEKTGKITSWILLSDSINN